MRVSVLQENFLLALNTVCKAIPSKPSQPVLGHVLLAAYEGRLYVTGTNFEAGARITVGAKVDEEGALAVPAKPLLAYVQRLPDERLDLTVDMARLTLHVACGEGKQVSFKGAEP